METVVELMFNILLRVYIFVQSRRYFNYQLQGGPKRPAVSGVTTPISRDFFHHSYAFILGRL